MKILIGIVSFLVVTQVNAGVFFKDTVLPKELQQMIVETIKKQVPCVASYSLKETETIVREERIDQGVVDYYYTTKIEGDYYFDSYHPAGMDVLIESVEYDSSNPTVEKYFITSTNLSQFTCERPY